VTPDKKVLNVGVGRGTTTTYVVENFGFNVVGVDIKENMGESAINWSKRKGLVDQTEFRFAGAQDLPFENDFFDILICESINIFVLKKRKSIYGIQACSQTERGDWIERADPHQSTPTKCCGIIS
jgi:ubiquinone/menaquinone biosynthesis C-methylase UbiE